MEMYLKILSASIVACLAQVLTLIFRPTTETIHDNKNTGYHNRQNNVMGLITSVKCNYDKTSNKMCTFRNVCYLPQSNEFLLIITNESKITGLNSKEDLKTISMSSVAKHNNLFMRFQIVINVLDRLTYETNITFIDKPVFLISRFKPDNIMHVIHDDILPIFMTYDSLCSGDMHQCVKRNNLIFADDKDEVTHYEWYRIFSNNKPLSLKDFQTVTCFDTLSVGLSRESLWFQYGFGEPQGPLNYASINNEVINRFKSFIFTNLKINSTFVPNDMTHAVIFSRKSNRKILNEDFVVNNIIDISKNLQLEFNDKNKIYILDVYQNKSTDIISLISKSMLLVGMHGSAMIYSLFLPNNAAVIELFPFGVQPQHVSPTRALIKLPGVYLNYISWRNFKEENSVAHPDWSPLLGGIQHLSKEKQNDILNLKEIPAVECCHNPSYLYRMYQDTIIDENFVKNLKQVLIIQKEGALLDSSNLAHRYLWDTWFFPGLVSNLSCVINKIDWVVALEWQEPFNTHIKNVNGEIKKSVVYSITVKIFNRVTSFETSSNSHKVQSSAAEINQLKTEPNGVQIWIKSIVNKIEGNDVHAYCSLLIERNEI